MNPTHALFKFASKWLSVAAIFVVTLEICARVEDALRWDAPIFGRYRHELLFTHDSHGEFNRPGSRYEKWSINSMGFRGPEISPRPEPGVFRIGVLGASETFGLFESEDREFPRQLQAILDSTGIQRFEVVNVAVAGMTVASMPSYYRNVVARIHPDLVVVYPSPHFYLDTDAPARRVNPAAAAQQASRPDIAQGEKHGLAAALPDVHLSVRQLRITSKGRDLVKRLTPVRLHVARNRWLTHRARSQHSPEWVWKDVPESRIDLFERHINELVDTIVASGADILLASHTNRFWRADRQMTPQDERHLSAMLKLLPRATPHVVAAIDSAAAEVIRTVGERRGIMVLDVDGRIPKTPEYFADYSHFTDQGASAIAQILAEHIGQASLAANTLRASPESPAQDRRNDAVSRGHASEATSKFGARVHAVAAQAGAGRRAAADSERRHGDSAARRALTTRLLRDRISGLNGDAPTGRGVKPVALDWTHGCEFRSDACQTRAQSVRGLLQPPSY